MRALGTLAEGDRPSKHKWPWEASQATGDGDGVTCCVRWGEVGWKEWNSGENQGGRTGLGFRWCLLCVLAATSLIHPKGNSDLTG